MTISKGLVDRQLGAADDQPCKQILKNRDGSVIAVAAPLSPIQLRQTKQKGGEALRWTPFLLLEQHVIVF